MQLDKKMQVIIASVIVICIFATSLILLTFQPRSIDPADMTTEELSETYGFYDYSRSLSDFYLSPINPADMDLDELSSINIPTISSENTPISKTLTTSPSCTIFTIAIGDTVFFGNNEDWRQQELRLWYIPAQTIATMDGERSIYGSVGIGFTVEGKGELYFNPCGGMNEHGLIFDINGLPSVDLYDNPNGSEFWTNKKCYIHPTLWDCRNVEEVIEWYKTYKWNTSMGGQLHYADASGDAVVISVNPSTNKWAFTRKTGNFIISTNFNLNNTGNAYDYPCYRYQRAEQMLSEIENEEDLTVQACADILYANHMEGACRTLYSNIFDPVNLDVYLNYGENYQKQKKVNLLDELRQRESFELFNISYMTGVDGHLLVKSVRIDENFYSSDETLQAPWILGLIPVLGLVSILRIRNRRKRKIRDVKS
ncbi:MAG: carcinine hydrolase/isopenicillin-N N-acyltransferase family protein [Promethearchaeota archaeon]